MAQELYKAKASGSLMLMGEHAVLHARPALVAAIDQYIHVTLIPRQDKTIKLISNLGTKELSLDSIEDDIATVEPFKFVLTAIQSFQSYLASDFSLSRGFASGFELHIQSDFSEKIGFGSSAAVVVATIKVLQAFMNHMNLKSSSEQDTFRLAKSAVLKVQGQGSGADVAASVFGGVVYYQNGQPQKLVDDQDEFPTIQAIYSGNKIPTPVVIAFVQQSREKHPSLFEPIFDAIAACTVQARDALLKKDWLSFGELMNIHHGLQSAMGLSNTILESLVYKLRHTLGIVGAKISGAGLGDCVIGIGNIKETLGSNHISLKLGTGCG